MSYSKSGKSSSPKSGKGSKGGKGLSYSMSMSYPPFCRDDSLTFNNCVIYIVDTKDGSDLPFQLQSIKGAPLGKYGTEQQAIDGVTKERKYVQATGDGEQGEYSACWEGSGVLVTDPVYFPQGEDCGDLYYL